MYVCIVNASYFILDMGGKLGLQVYLRTERLHKKINNTRTLDLTQYRDVPQNHQRVEVEDGGQSLEDPKLHPLKEEKHRQVAVSGPKEQKASLPLLVGTDTLLKVLLVEDDQP